MGRSITTTSQEIKFLSIEDIIRIHNEVLKRFGGGFEGIYPDGYGKLDLMLNRMKCGIYGVQPFDTLLKKTSFMFQSISLYHAFIDGMKRTAIFSSMAFLLRNNYLFISNDVKESVDFAIYVADEMKDIDPEESLDIIYKWFNKRIISLFDGDKITKFVRLQNPKFICPRCHGNLTMDKPLCTDCGNQLIKFNFVFDAIIEKYEVVLTRKKTRKISKKGYSHPTILR